MQHSGIKTVSAAAHIDKKYADLYDQARNAGVEVIAYQTKISSESLTIENSLAVV